MQKEFSIVPTVYVDRHKLMQIFLNLLKNAKQAILEHNESTKEIIIKIERHNSEHVALSIIDSGIGIPEKNMDNIFHFGFTTKEDGHGFGLHSCVNQLQEMGGRIEVSSPGLEEGACFKVLLPTCTSQFKNKNTQ